MKKLPVLIILLTTICFWACKKDAINNNYDESYAKWLSFKNSSHNSYTYTAYGSSVFGYYTQTKFTVQNGKITGREFLSGSYISNTNGLTTNKSWIENSTSLNTHGTEGYELLTLDEVYIKAKTVWLKANTKENDVYFESRNNGILSSAGYVPKGCMDDCFTGINIKDIQPL